MKAIIMEIAGNKAVILTENGQFRTIRLAKWKNLFCGDEIDYGVFSNGMKLPSIPSFSQVAIAVAVLVFVVLPMTMTLQSRQIHGYVNLDINPSIQLAYNSHQKVIKARPLNEDGIVLLQNFKLKASVQESLEELVEQAIAQGYINNEKENGVIVTFTELSTQLNKAAVEAGIEMKLVAISEEHLLTYYLESDSATLDLANERDTSPGLYKLKLDLASEGEDDEDLEKLNNYELIQHHNHTDSLMDKDEEKTSNDAEDKWDDDDAEIEFNKSEDRHSDDESMEDSDDDKDRDQDASSRDSENSENKEKSVDEGNKKDEQRSDQLEEDGSKSRESNREDRDDDKEDRSFDDDERDD